MWRHVLLATPLFGLGLFFALPFAWALPIYLVLVLAASFVYYKIMERTHEPVITGRAALVGQVVNTDGNGAVHWQGQWWTADPYLPNRRVRVVALQGLRLDVEPISAQTVTGPSDMVSPLSKSNTMHP